VTVDGHVGQRALQALRDGVQLEDGMTAPAGVRQIRPSVIEITIHEGRKRQVKRMCQAVNHPVRSLQRIAFGPLRLGDLSPGQSRRLTPAEVQRLRDASPIASDR
jgi:23S rRNA pseudouridine2605 synthase